MTMERIGYFCRRHVLPLLLLPLLLSGCVDEFPVTTEVPYGGDGKGLSVEEAKTFFESNVSGKASRSGEPEEHDNGFYIRRLMLPVGEFVPSWEEGLSTDAPSLYSVDVPVRSDFSFRVLRVDKGSGKVYQTKCWHKLVVVKDSESGNMGCFIAFFIPDRAYALSHGGDIGRVLTNGEEMGDYSGVKIYTTLEGRRVRVNRYENGKKVEGIYIDGASDREDYIFRMLHSEKIIGKVWLQRSRPKTPVSRGEDDWVDDFWDDWWEDTFDDDSWSDDGWSDDSSNDSDNPLDTSNDNFFQIGTDGYGDDVYYNSDDDTYYIDIDGDGFVDSAYVNDGYDESDSGDDWSSGDDSWVSADPDPLPDPGDAPTDSGEEQENVGGGSGETNNNEEGGESLLADVKIPYSASSYPGYVPGERNCKDVADMIMYQILGADANIGSKNVVVQLYEQLPSKTLVLKGNIENVFNILNDHLDSNRPITVGVDRGIYSLINEKATDHWIVIVGRGYDESKQEYYFTYIETGRYENRGNEAVSDKNRIYYEPNDLDGAFKGINWSGKTYIITQIRPNK